jgi:hypothetical protein
MEGFAMDELPDVAVAQPAKVEEINPQAFVNDAVEHIFKRWRKDDPVHRTYNSIEGVGDYWSVTRYRDIVYVETHNELFSSDWFRGGITLREST